MSTLSWKKNFFDGSVDFYKDGDPVGELKDKFFKRTSTGRLNEKRLTFQKKGVFSEQIEIYSQDTKVPVGNIKFNTWKTKAQITLGSHNYEWKYTNTWQTKWGIFENDIQVLESNSKQRGQIATGNLDEALVLTGFQLQNYFSSTGTVVFIAFIMIITLI